MIKTDLTDLIRGFWKTRRNLLHMQKLPQWLKTGTIFFLGGGVRGQIYLIPVYLKVQQLSSLYLEIH